jgi:membrane-bound ClpP family serine protease
MKAQHKAGLVLLALLAAADLSLPFVTDGDHPPMWVAIIALVLGLASFACLPAAWRGRRPGLLGLLATRLLSTLLALPVFFVDDAPDGAVLGVAATVALTVLGAVLSMAGTRGVVTA